MNIFDQYHLPTTVNAALELLAQYEGRARVIAGGTDLLVDTQADYHEGQRPHFDALIDVTKIAGADEIRKEDGFIEIGCGVTHTQIVSSKLIQQRATALAEACFVVGGPQVRNVATLCGNVAHALPAADGTVALMALDAQVQVFSYQSSVVSNQWRSLASIFKGPGKSAVDSTREIITAIRFRPCGEKEASAFARVMRPQGVALPIMGMATKIQCTMLNGQCTIQNVAISAGPVAPIPFRANRTEEFLRGKILNDVILQEAGEILLSEAQPRTSAHRATKEYRIELLPTLLAQTLRAAMGSRVTFLTYNILDGGRGREHELSEIIASQNADVILLQEVAEQEFVVQLAARLRAKFFIAESNSWRTLALLTTLPIQSASSCHPRILRHTCLHATLEYAPEKTITLFGIHLAAPAYTLLVEMYRLRELNLILKQIERARTEKIVLAGDFNSIAPGDAVDLSGVPWHVRASVVLQGGLLARQVIAKLRKNIFLDCFRALHPRENGFTLPPNPPRVRLDYFFVNDALRQNLRACDVVTTPDAVKRASDHLPVRMELEL